MGERSSLAKKRLGLEDTLLGSLWPPTENFVRKLALCVFSIHVRESSKQRRCYKQRDIKMLNKTWS